MSKPVKLADIAKAMNVSTVTVSKALAGKKGVSEEKREQIRNLAREMGYQPPSGFRPAEEKKTYNVGVLVSERYLDQFESFYWKMYQSLALEAAAGDCFTVLEVLSRDMEQRRELPKLLQENAAEGIIILGLLRDDYMETVVQALDMPFVCLDFYDKNQEYDAVVTDNFYGMYQMTRYLLEMGHRRIAYVGSLQYTASITDRYFGYARALLEYGITARPEEAIGDRDIISGRRDLNHHFDLPEELPTAFVCNCDWTAGLLINDLRKRGFRVPEDISVVGFDDYIHPGICPVAITTYAVDMGEMSRRALSLLMKKIDGTDYRRGISIVDGHMVVRNSARAPELVL